VCQGGAQSHVISPPCCWTLADLIGFFNSQNNPRGGSSSSPTNPAYRVLELTGEIYILRLETDITKNVTEGETLRCFLDFYFQFNINALGNMNEQQFYNIY